MYVRAYCTYFHNSRRSNNLGTDMERNGAWERERVGAGDGGGPRGAGIYVRTYVPTYVPTGVRTYLCTYVHTYVHVCGWVFQCLRLYRYVTYVRQLEGGKVDSGKVLFGTALDEHCGWRLVLLRPAAPSAGGAQLTSRLRRKWRPKPGPKPLRGSSSHGGRE